MEGDSIHIHVDDLAGGDHIPNVLWYIMLYFQALFSIRNKLLVGYALTTIFKIPLKKLSVYCLIWRTIMTMTDACIVAKLEEILPLCERLK